MLRLQHLPCVVLLLSSVWTTTLTQSCTGGDETPRDVVLAWFKDRVLQGLGLQRPPVPGMQGPDGDTARSDARQRHTRSSRVDRVDRHQHQHQHHQPSQTSQIIVFPSADSLPGSEDTTSSSCFTYYFQPSLNSQESLVTSAHFWFYAGEGATSNSSAPLFILTAEQRLLQAAEVPSRTTSDGWVTYHLGRDLRASVSEGPFVLQVRCVACECHANESDKLPFLHLHAGPRGSPDRSPARRAAGPIPWSPSAMDLLQRPSQDRPQHSDCNREDIEINFEELGWDNWIVHPKVLTFQYCVGNCSAWDRATSMLGIKQCCAPVPGTMKSLRITTTSDGGYSFKYETLPNIIAEECTCI